MGTSRRDFVKLASGVLALRRWPAKGSDAARAGARRERGNDDPAHAYPDLKIYDADGHPWRAAQENWRFAKDHIGEIDAWGAWLAEEQVEVDTWMAKFPRDRVEWTRGYGHWFVSPKDGSALTWGPDIPGVDEDYFTSPTDDHVAMTPQLTQAWATIFRNHHKDYMVRAAMLYRLTGRERYRIWASAQLDYYAAHYTEWYNEPQNFGAHLEWEPLGESVLCYGYAETVRHLEAVAPSPQLGTWRRQLFNPILQVVNGQKEAAINNRAVWCRSLAAIVALLFDDAPAWHEALNGKFGLRAQIANGITPDGIWYEQSFGYNAYVLEAVQGLFTIAGVAGRADELGREMTACENLLLAPLYLRFPNGMLPTVADTRGSSMEPYARSGLFRGMYRIFPTTLGREDAASAQDRDWDTLLDRPLPSPRDVVLPEVVSRNFEHTRMAVIRTDPWQAFFHYGQLTASHAQREALNFAVCYGSVDVTHGTGVVGYTSPLNDYYMSALNHNVPFIDGRGQDEIGLGELKAFSASPPRVSAAQPYGGGGRATRTLSIENGRLIDTVDLDSRRGEPHHLGLALHLQGRVKVPSAFQAATDAPYGQPLVATYWRDMTAADFTDSAEFDVDYGAVTLRVALAVPGPFRVWHAQSPDNPDVTKGTRESLYVETLAARTTFSTTFSAIGSGQT